ncbi:MAG: hypothetical protein K6G26_04390 [Lachnospiraceae bacterium]|nr:hypothetical protein [Lachnospiraceae bacterium]
MKTSRRNYNMSDMYCTGCGMKMRIPRRKSCGREKGHLKKLYCYICKEDKNFIEVKDTDFTLNHMMRKQKIRKKIESEIEWEIMM